MSRNKAIFVDRDGVINKDPGGWTKYNYVTKWKEFRFLPGAKKAVKDLSDRGYDIIIISNQAGVNKGYFTKTELNRVTARMMRELERSGGVIRKAYYCIHQDSDRCNCRKPKAGLFRQAEKELGIKTRGAYFIGDTTLDVEAGKKAHLKVILVLSGKAKMKDIAGWKAKPDFVFKDLSKAVSFVLKGGR